MSDPSAGVVNVGCVFLYTGRAGLCPFDLCLFSIDLSEVVLEMVMLWGCPTPRPGSYMWVASSCTQVCDTSCLDLCLFNSDLSEVDQSFSRVVVCGFVGERTPVGVRVK